MEAKKGVATTKHLAHLLNTTNDIQLKRFPLKFENDNNNKIHFYTQYHIA